MRKNTYNVLINFKDKSNKIKRISCSSKEEIHKNILKLHQKGITSYTFTLMKNGLRYKEFNLVNSLIQFIKYLPLIKEEN